MIRVDNICFHYIFQDYSLRCRKSEPTNPKKLVTVIVNVIFLPAKRVIVVASSKSSGVYMFALSNARI